MLEIKFDPNQPHPYIRYARMSDKTQNPRSPDQQMTVIDATLRSLGRPWVHLGDYRDDGISGRYHGRRPGFQQMLHDIDAGVVKPDLILVDERERFSRADEAPEVITRLRNTHGVLVLTADSSFSDPTTTSGKVLEAFEHLRSTEETRIKARRVLRGKRDAASLKHWPGGPPPFGYRLESVFALKNGRQEVAHTVLVQDPDTNWVVVLVFEKAMQGMGTPRLARYLNERPDIPDACKPFYSDSIGYMLDNPVYYGTLRYQQYSTGIVNDTRRVVRNPDDDVLFVPNHCPPTVSEETWKAVQLVREGRRRARRGPGDDPAAKRIMALAPGLPLRYPLTGLVRCGDCGRSMQPSSSRGASTTGRVYSYYRCPGFVAGVCSHRRYVRETWLRDAVFRRLREHLFPSGGDVGEIPGWFAEVAAAIKAEFERTHADSQGRRSVLQQELDELKGNLRGWAKTLASPDLPDVVRADIIRHYADASDRARQIEAEASADAAGTLELDAALDMGKAIEALRRFSDVMSRMNPAEVNIELAKHIESINCYEDGRVTMRTTKVGLFGGATTMLSRNASSDPDAIDGQPGPKVPGRITPRRRGKLRVPVGGDSPSTTMAQADARLDPARFEGLASPFFWEDDFVTPRHRSWAREHALEVARKLRETGWTQARLGQHFGRSQPTIRHALRLAEEMRAESPVPNDPPTSNDAATF